MVNCTTLIASVGRRVARATRPAPGTSGDRVETRSRHDWRLVAPWWHWPRGGDVDRGRPSRRAAHRARCSRSTTAPTSSTPSWPTRSARLAFDDDRAPTWSTAWPRRRRAAGSLPSRTLGDRHPQAVPRRPTSASTWSCASCTATRPGFPQRRPRRRSARPASWCAAARSTVPARAGGARRPCATARRARPGASGRGRGAARRRRASAGRQPVRAAGAAGARGAAAEHGRGRSPPREAELRVRAAAGRRWARRAPGRRTAAPGLASRPRRPATRRVAHGRRAARGARRGDFPLYPLVPDPRDPTTTPRGETICFGVVPTGRRDVDAAGDARFDDRALRDPLLRAPPPPECPRDGGHCPCPLAWSEPTRAVPARRRTSTSRARANRPVTVQLPDLGAARRPTRCGSRPAAGGVRFQSPPGSGLDVQRRRRPTPRHGSLGERSRSAPSRSR